MGVSAPVGMAHGEDPDADLLDEIDEEEADTGEQLGEGELHLRHRLSPALGQVLLVGLVRLTVSR